MSQATIFSRVLLPCMLLPVHGELTGEIDRPDVLNKIAFGSCYNPRDKVHTMFSAVAEHKPDVFVLLGDNIYGDSNDMSVLKKKYSELEAVEEFRKLRDSTRLLATWDDHDFGANDGGNSYAMREESEAIFLDFFKDPADSPRRKRDGVYASYTFGKDDRVVQLILLDTRYFRDVIPRSKSPKKPGTVGWYEPINDSSLTLLGETQWKWLDEQLQVPANIRIIGSSIQMLADEKGMENWGNVPHERKRFFDLLKKHRANGTFAISGDVHFAELSKMEVDGYPFYDFTSSGLSHVSRSWAGANNSRRIGESYPVLNAGLIEIDWKSRAVELSVINTDGEKIAPKVIQLGELTFPE